jgi:galactokinase
VKLVSNNEKVLGSRMMGGGFGGCSINLVEKGSENELIEKTSNQYRSQFGIELKAYKVKISKGTTQYKNKRK